MTKKELKERLAKLNLRVKDFLIKIEKPPNALYRYSENDNIPEIYECRLKNLEMVTKMEQYDFINNVALLKGEL